MLTEQFRRNFLDYFKKHGHTPLPSSPVLPHDDPTLLFTNAGMNQFKDVFLGKSKRDYTRAATSQKCIRVGGKHNDLDNVGHTSRHLTFFEMIGNFSFGDYFKEDAIRFAWEVSTQVFGFEKDKIWPTVYKDDEEAFNLWKKYVPAERITKFGDAENFWAMGDTGPCGPCSELLYDRGEKYGQGKTPAQDPSGERFLEFWNLVFMQYNRQADGTMTPLPKPSIDTGAGLERIISLKMGVDNVFETDVLRHIIAKVEEVSGKKYDSTNPALSAPFKVIADHLRCLSFAIADGVQPSNVDRGYVLRKVLRRAVRYGRTLGFEEPFLAKILPSLIETMGRDYHELQAASARIAEILTIEEEAFIRTLKRGGNILGNIMQKAHTSHKQISGDDAFKLKDTYGFPLEEILLLAKDEGVTVDTKRYEALEEEARERSRSVHKSTQQIAGVNLFAPFVEKEGPCQFTGYIENETASTLKGIVMDGAFVDKIHAGQEAILLLDKSPFYAEMGGQVGDRGTLSNQEALFSVSNTLSPFKGVIAHIGTLQSGTLSVGDALAASVDAVRRQKIANNHTATHLLHYALQKVLGEHIKQAGSVVDEERLRFDFSHHKPVSTEEIREIEDLINEKIRENKAVSAYELSYDEAQKRSDIKQFFGEKYGSSVRVIDIDYSKELCGGTHTSCLGNIGLFRIAKESSIAAGVRRIEAVTGRPAELLARESEDAINSLAGFLKAQPNKIFERVEKLIEENKEMGHKIKTMKKEELKLLTDKLLQEVETIKGKALLTAIVDASQEEIKTLADDLMDKLSSCVLVIGAKAEGRGSLLIRVSDDLVNQGVKANELIKELAPLIGGTGGGKPNNAQAGGKEPDMLGKALQRARELL
jgi:alanyl-tRNA synthetase